MSWETGGKRTGQDELANGGDKSSEEGVKGLL